MCRVLLLSLLLLGLSGCERLLGGMDTLWQKARALNGPSESKRTAQRRAAQIESIAALHPVTSAALQRATVTVGSTDPGGFRSAHPAAGREAFLSTTVSAHGPQAIHLAVGGKDTWWVRLTALDELPAETEVVDGKAVRPEAYTATSSMLAAGRQHAEIFYLLESDQAPRQFRWRVEASTHVKNISGSPDIRVGENDDGSWVGEGRLDGGGRRET